MTFPMKRNDLEPRYAAKLVAGGAPIPLTGCTVKFIMTKKGSPTPKVSAPAAIDNALGGLVSYAWAAGDTDTSGVYLAEWEIMYPGARPRTVPSEGHAFIDITDDLG